MEVDHRLVLSLRDRPNSLLNVLHYSGRRCCISGYIREGCSVGKSGHKSPHTASSQCTLRTAPYRQEGQLYIDPMSPFGLHSALKIFNAVADALHWHLNRAGVQFIWHYLDDYIIIVPPNSEQCMYDLQLLLRDWEFR